MTRLCYLVGKTVILSNIPGSKSIINRLLVMTLYHDMDYRIEHANLCDDVLEMLEIYSMIGKRYRIDGDTLYITKGYEVDHVKNSLQVSIKNAGTTLRFILPFFAFYDRADEVCIKLGERLSKRPIEPLITCLCGAGADIVKENDTIYIKTKRFFAHSMEIDCSSSSQFLSSLILFSTSLRYHTNIHLVGDFVSQSYVTMTKQILVLFGCKTRYCFTDNQISAIRVHPSDSLPSDNMSIILDPDYSTICYIWLYSYLTKNEIFVKKITSIYQPDYAFVKVMRALGIKFIEKDGYTAVAREQDPQSITSHPHYNIDMSDMPDQIITLAFFIMTLGVSADIYGCQTLVSKESDRISGIIENISTIGGVAQYHDGTLHIEAFCGKPKPCTLRTFHDHRFALTFWAIKHHYPQIEIDDLACISKSVDFVFFQKIAP